MTQDVTVRPEALSDDRWEPVRCVQHKRIIDINHARLQVRYWCERCRVAHTVQVGTFYTGESA